MDAREHFRAASDLFLEAASLPAEQVDAFLNQRCGSDRELRSLLERLLAASTKPGAFETLARDLRPMHLDLLDRLPMHDRSSDADTRPSAPVHDRFEEQPDEIIGRFRLLERIGEGGFGHVWLAEQREPVQRRVALKLIKAGM